MGHMLNETIQDILVRRARMEGKNACWVPGTDHASIATEAKVVNRLAEQGINKADLTREEFLSMLGHGPMNMVVSFFGSCAVLVLVAIGIALHSQWMKNVLRV